MKNKSFPLQKICIFAGILLLVAAVATLGLWRWNVARGEEKAEAYVQTLSDLIPEARSSTPEARLDNKMSVLSVDDRDFVGLLEMPQYDSLLPVGAKWGQSSWYPCRFDGSIYDGTLQIGTTTEKGQYDFYRQLSPGDSLFFTDAEGNRFALEITSLQWENHADKDSLGKTKAPLTIFIKNIYSFEYLVVSCDVRG